MYHPETEPGVVEEIELLGFDTIWVPDISRDRLQDIEAVLAATSSIQVGSGIANIWTTPVEVAAEFFHRAEDLYPGRFFLGIGLGHRERDGQAFGTPYEATVWYLDGLARARVPRERIVLAALRKRVLGLSRDRTAGGYPINMPLAHTRFARATLGEGPFLTVGLNVVFEEDQEKARGIARESVRYYTNLVNYVNAWREFGFPDAQVGEEPSNELVDAITSYGSIAAITTGVQAQLDTGANQVVLRVLPDDGGRGSLSVLTALAHQLGLT